MTGFHQRLRQLRQLNHLTLDELANALETTKTTLSRYENHKRIPDADFVIRVAKYFRVSTDYMLQQTNHPTTVDDLLGKRHYYIDGLKDDDYQAIEAFIEALKHQRKSIT